MRKLLNQIFTQLKQPFISSFDYDMSLDYVMFFTKSVKLELRSRLHLTSWTYNFPKPAICFDKNLSIRLFRNIPIFTKAKSEPVVDCT